jgi:hypothetical protein
MMHPGDLRRILPHNPGGFTQYRMRIMIRIIEQIFQLTKRISKRCASPTLNHSS